MGERGKVEGGIVEGRGVGLWQKEGRDCEKCRGGIVKGVGEGRGRGG